MPICSRCGITQATVEMRVSPKRDNEGERIWLCKSKIHCDSRRLHARAQKKSTRMVRRRGYQD